MAVVQSTYPATPPAGFPGMVANGETSNRISRSIEDAGGIAFGKAAFQGTNNRGVTATPAAGALMGFIIADHGLPLLPGGTADVVPQYEEASVLALGTMYVSASVAVAKRDQVYITPGGAITNVSSSNIIAPGWFFDETIASAGIVIIARR